MLTCDTAVDKFGEHLEHDPVYPFNETDPGVYTLNGNHGGFRISLAVCLTVVFITTFYYAFEPADEYLIFPILIFGWLTYVTWYHHKRRLYILDGTIKRYKFFIGESLEGEGQYHNIYIRLEARNPRIGKTRYRLVLDGHQLEDHHLTSYGTEYPKIYAFGRQLASALNLNYFDCKHKSRNHIIRHRPAQGTTQCPSV